MKLISSTTVAVGLTLPLATHAIPPENFGFPSAPNDTVLSASFRLSNGTYEGLQPGSLFGINIPSVAPTLALQTSLYQSLANYTGSYLVCMVDPDASYPQSPTSRFILHWLQPNVTLSTNSTSNTQPSTLALPSAAQLLTNTSAPYVPYRRPSPPTNSSAHRYILYAFQQPSNFSIPAAFAGYSDSNRTRFNLTSFISAARLGTPAAANYMYVTNQSSVPGDFVAAAGGSYPGGNGMAVTSGDPATTATAMASGSSSASGSGSATGSVSTGGSSSVGTSTGAQSSSASSAGAAMITGMGSLVGAGLIGLAALF